jgi:hypothetical protein
VAIHWSAVNEVSGRAGPPPSGWTQMSGGKSPGPALTACASLLLLSNVSNAIIPMPYQ